MNCEDVRKELSLFLYGELSFEEEESVHQHLEGCEECRRALAREKTWHEALDRSEATPPAHLLGQCRRDLRQTVQSTSARTTGLRGFLSSVRQPWVASFLRPAGALALVAVGFLAARLAPLGGPERAPLGLAATEPMAAQVRYLQPDSSGNVRIVLDETRQRVLTGSLDDADIQRVLLTAASQSSDPGLRVVSMDMLKSRSESVEIRHALLQALRLDPNAGVRLKALEGLKSYAAEPEIRSALAHALLTDDNPGVRIQAIDLLTEQKEIEMAGLLQELLRKEENNYVRLRCQRALREMNASLETF